MPKGGHARSGPPPDPNSARSDQRGIQFTALPASGYDGEVPKFPLPGRTVYRWEYEDKRRFQVPDLDATRCATDRELELWAWLWTTPQACAWAQPSERWRLHTIAMYVRTFVICEGDEATAADKGSLHRFADDIGMTPAGLRVNGWAIARTRLARSAGLARTKTSPQRRLRAADAAVMPSAWSTSRRSATCIDGWIEQHCRVPDGFSRGQAVPMPYDWQFWCHGQPLPGA